jgi:tRNA dimethylallyltransferase
VALACQLAGEIISADSRQVYRGLDVGSGKDLVEYGEVPYHLIDVADPKNRFSVAEYQKMAYAAIENVLDRGKQPIIVGGSGQYLEAVVEGYKLKEIKPNETLRANLEEKEADEVFEILKEKNQAFAEKLNNSDKNNKRRLIRYIEVQASVVLPSEPKGEVFGRKESAYDFLILGLTHPSETLSSRIKKRLIERLEKENMIQEVSDLHDKVGLSWERLIEFGLEYKFIAQYLQEKIDYDQMAELIHRSSCQFAKKQMTWYKRWEKQGRKIHWVAGIDEAQEKINKFLGK